MSALSAGTAAFASIVGLIGQFLNERRTGTAQDYEEFKSWLAENRHEDIIRLLEQNAATVTNIKALLTQDRATLLQRFDQLDHHLAVIAQMVQGLGGIAQAIRPEVRISRHALAFLREIDRSGSSAVLEMGGMGGRKLFTMDTEKGLTGVIRYGDERFFEDDVHQLITAELLRLAHDKQGNRILHLTRQAVALVESSGTKQGCSRAV